MQKYWIEKSGHGWKGPDHNSHGNPWYVFTSYYDEDDDDLDSQPTTISIPYHSDKEAYLNGNIDKGYQDFYEQPQAWNGWLSLSREQRREYIREFRRNNNNKMKTTPFEERQLLAKYTYGIHAATVACNNQFVTFQGHAKTAGCVTETKPTKENNEMTNDAVYHLERDLAKAYHLAQNHLREKHHLDPHRAETLREYIAMVKADEYESFTDKELDYKYPEYASPASSIVLRKHKADHTAHSADTAKLDEAYRAANLAVKTSTDHDKTRKETTETFRKTWLH